MLRNLENAIVDMMCLDDKMVGDYYYFSITLDYCSVGKDMQCRVQLFPLVSMNIEIYLVIEQKKKSYL